MAGPEDEEETVSLATLVYPNPVSTEMNLLFSSNVEEQQVVQLFDLSGREVMRKSIPVSTGENVVTLDLSDLQSGLYLLCRNEEKENSIRIVKK